MSKPVRVGLIGSQFISTIQAEALKTVAGEELFAVASPSGDHAKDFARMHSIPHHGTDYRQMFEMVVLGLPNDLHCQAN